MRRARRRSDRAESDLSVIGVCPSVPMTDIGVVLRVLWRLTSVVVMSCRTGMSRATVVGAAAVRVPALCRHSLGRHRARDR
jgi:hypothetical protein